MCCVHAAQVASLILSILCSLDFSFDRVCGFELSGDTAEPSGETDSEASTGAKVETSEADTTQTTSCHSGSGSEP